MNLESLSLSWVDILVVALLGVGLWRGRKRGMSEECLDIVKWALIVLVCGVAYQPAGQLLSETVGFLSPLAWYVTVYILLAIIIAVTFTIIRKGPGSKLTGSDAFGSAEYYLGMVAGMFRYTCIIIVAMSLVNARQYSDAEVKSKVKYQEDNFGTTFFMTLPDIQRAVFTQSISGRMAREHLSIVLIRPTPAGGTAVAGVDSVVRARERSGYDLLGQK